MMKRKEKIVVNPAYKDVEPFVNALSSAFARGEGEVIYKGRNELRRMEYGGRSLVVKSFHTNAVNRFVYGTFRKSKAERSYIHALALEEIGVGTPSPVAFVETYKGVVLSSSFYVSLMSECSNVYVELFEKPFACEDEVMREIGRVTAAMHEHGYAHKDYGRGNILFLEQPDGRVKLDIVDLNRMHIGPLDIKKGCKNLERLPASPRQHRLIAEEYARARGFDAERCYSLMRAYRSVQPWKLDAEGFNK